MFMIRCIGELAMHNSQPGAEVIEQAPVPHWGWGVAPPCRP
jgi:hemoglobin